MPDKPPTANPIYLGVSACLLGEETRYDGGHAHNPFVTETLAASLELISVCPEAELGMGIPRETVDLWGAVDSPQMIATDTRRDWTGPMNRWSRRRARELAELDLCGYVFKNGSPSCGLHRVKVHQSKGPLRRRGRGLFAAEFARRFPLVPLVDEAQLSSAVVRDNFIVRVFALARLRRVFAGRWRAAEVVAFHERETALLQAHHRQVWRELSRLVATLSKLPRADFRDRYQMLFMASLARAATRHKTARVLHQLARRLPVTVRARLVACTQDYERGQAPLLVPLTLLSHLGHEYGIPELADSSFVAPDPRELLLRFHA